MRRLQLNVIQYGTALRRVRSTNLNGRQITQNRNERTRISAGLPRIVVVLVQAERVIVHLSVGQWMALSENGQRNASAGAL